MVGGKSLRRSKQAIFPILLLTETVARHLMTGTGAYFYIQWGIWLRHCLNGRQEEYDLIWPRLWSLPEVVRTERGNGIHGLHSSKKEI